AIVSSAVAIARVVQRRRSVVNIVANGALSVITAVSVVLALFYLMWGLNYARKPLPARLGWSPIERPADAAASQRQTDEIAAITRQLIEATNQSYREFAKSDDLGRPSALPAASMPLDATLDAAYARVQQKLGLEAEFGVRRGRAKPLAASIVLNH